MPFLNLDNNYSNLAQYYNQSFVNRPSIPTKAEQFLPFDDGFIRGGLSNATLASTKDVIRIGKFITGLSNISKITDIKATTLQTATKGILFLSKQVGLQRTNPRLEWDRSNPLPPLLGGATRQFTGVGMLESVGGNAFGLHFDRAGLLGKIRSDQKYGGDLNNTTSGVAYVNNFGSGRESNLKISPTSSNRLLRYVDSINSPNSSLSPTSIELDRYTGGSNSLYGVGLTTIRTTQDIRTTIFNSDLGTTDTTTDIYSPGTPPSPNFIGPILPKITQQTTTSFTNPNLILKLNGFTPLTNKQIINTSTADLLSILKFQLKASPLPRNKGIAGYNIEQRIGVSNQSNLDSINTINIIDSKTFYDYSDGPNSSGSNFINELSTKKVFNESTGSISPFANDLIKFRIEFLNNESPISDGSINTDVLAFRAYLDDFSDGMNAKWDSYRYMGRGEEFYVYNGFTRDIGLAFTIHAHNEKEMAPLYSKLNYLMSTFTPDYSSQLKMRGNIAYLTVGDYIYRQPGVFTDIKISGLLEGSWDIGLNANGTSNGQYELPRMVKVGLSFKPIHSFLPRRNYSGPIAGVQTFPAAFITPDRQAYPSTEKNNRYLNTGGWAPDDPEV